jgi:hypothetical protein
MNLIEEIFEAIRMHTFGRLLPDGIEGADQQINAQGYGVLCKIFFLVATTLRPTSACQSVDATSIGISSSTFRACS